MATPIQILSSHSIVSADVRTALKTLTLPVVSTNRGKLLFIKDTFGNSANCNINLSTIGLDRFERSINSNLRLSTNFGCWTLTNTGTSNWIFLNSYTNSIPKYPLASSFLYSPAAIQSLRFWFDAADPTTVTSNGSAVTSWRSKTGGLILRQTTLANSPSYNTVTQNGLPTLTFSAASSTSLTSSNVPFVGANSLTIIAAFKPSDIFTRGWVFCVNNSAGFYPGTIVFGRDGPPSFGKASVGPHGNLVNYNGAADEVFIPNDPSSANWRVMTFMCNRNQGQSTIFINSSNLSNVAVDSLFGTTYLDTISYNFNITMGCQNNNTGVPGSNGTFFTGNLGEILIFTSALSDTDRFKAEAYLATKWGNTTDLSVTNPYKTTPPTFAN